MSAMLKTIIRKLLLFLGGTVLFTGLPLLSFNPFHLADFFSNYSRMLYVIISPILNLLVVILLPNEGRSAGDGISSQRKHRISLGILSSTPILILLAAPFCDAHNLFRISALPYIRVLGLILFIAGFILMNYAAYALGRFFSVAVTLQKNHALIQSGPFRFIRHPRYLGIIVTFTGITLLFNSWASFGFIAIIMAALLWRIHDEEFLMHKHFGKQWEAYTAKSWKLLPPVF